MDTTVPPLVLGFRRGDGGRPEAVCEPDIGCVRRDFGLLADRVQLSTDEYLAVVRPGVSVVFVGRMRPNEIVRAVGNAATRCEQVMCESLTIFDREYPMSWVVAGALEAAKFHLPLIAGDAFVEAVPPSDNASGRCIVEPPRLMETANGKTRVAVTGLPRRHALRDWLNAVLCLRVRDAILEKYARSRKYAHNA